MTAGTVTTLASALRGFFTQHLPQVRGASPHTIRSYRDSLALLLRFVATHGRQSVAQLDLDALTPDVIIAFLNDSERTRRNRSSTRNVRLAAIHAFFRFVASVHPEHLEPCQRILAIPFKRSAHARGRVSRILRDPSRAPDDRSDHSRRAPRLCVAGHDV
jgi:integrase/recombinase XerD